jgi:hypothetical protein
MMGVVALLAWVAVLVLVTTLWVRAATVAAAVFFLRFSGWAMMAGCVVLMLLATATWLLGPKGEISTAEWLVFVLGGIPLLCLAGWFSATLFFSLCLNAALLRQYRASQLIEEGSLAGQALRFVRMMRWVHWVLFRLRGVQLSDVLRIVGGQNGGCQNGDAAEWH